MRKTSKSASKKKPEHPHQQQYKIRVMCWSDGGDGRLRFMSRHRFSTLSDAIAFQDIALRRPLVARAEVILVLATVERERPRVPSLVPESVP